MINDKTNIYNGMQWFNEFPISDHLNLMIQIRNRNKYFPLDHDCVDIVVVR